MQDPHTLARWRLVLGKEAEKQGISCKSDADAERIEQLVGFLFEEGDFKDGTPKGNNKEDRRAGM